MDRHSVLANFAQRIRTACSASKWHDLRSVDAEMAQLLRKLPDWQGWTQAERVALEDLKSAHAEARAHCARESALYAARMASMRENRIGWMAYAMQNDGSAGRP
jgi:hypothetical protein